MIQITNAGSQSVALRLDGSPIGTLFPTQSVRLPAPGSGTFHLTLGHVEESYTKSNTAHLMVEADYLLSADESADLTVTREKIRFDLNGYYDRFILSARNTQIPPQTYRVTNVKTVEKRLKRHKIIAMLITEPLDNIFFDFFTEFILQFGCFGIVLYFAAIIALIVAATIFHFWKYVLLVLLILWILDILIGRLVERSGSWLLRKIFKKTDAIEETALSQLSRWCDPAFLAAYYAQPDRKPFSGKIEH